MTEDRLPGERLAQVLRIFGWILAVLVALAWAVLVYPSQSWVALFLYCPGAGLVIVFISYILASFVENVAGIRSALEKLVEKE